MSRWDFWIDRGGTFTDVVARDPDGEIHTAKLLSENPDQYPDAALEGIRRFLGLGSDEAIPAARINAVKMGTTVATNALLERKGDRTLLVITKGLRDQLRLGYQNRPRLFDRHIVLPELLYEQVVEADERLLADGSVETPLDEDALRERLGAAKAEGIDAVAIVFVHAYRHARHEKRAARIAREMGFGQVSASHEVSPLMKMVSRGDTTVVDAYLSPILRRYVDRVASAFDRVGEDEGAEALGGKLMFMMSSGGLTDATLFQGKDAILSGPAGGVVGAVRTSEIADERRIIGFDMGGTSTDVCHYNGEFERVLHTEVAGVRLRAPEFFPSIFGPDADQPLDAAATRKAFEAMAEDVGRAPEELADGFLRIACENMANAVKKISVQRGHDVSDYCLTVFGGAGAQHACRIADLLGMERALIHPLASLLSAYGVGLADVRSSRQQAVEARLTRETRLQAAADLDRISMIVGGEVEGQGVNPKEITYHPRLLLKVEGTDTAIEIPLSTEADMREAFAEAHRQRFGFDPGDKPLVIEAISQEAVGRAADLSEPSHPTDEREETAFPTALERVLLGRGVAPRPLREARGDAPGRRSDRPRGAGRAPHLDRDRGRLAGADHRA